MEKLSTRAGYGKALAELAEKYNYYVLDSDLAEATKTIDFAKRYPERFFDMGIAESDMMGTAAGLAACGATVFASTFAVFAAGRAYEQVRNAICYNNLNVKVVGTHGGILIGEDGGSHQAIEDVSLMRTIPNMKVLVPSDAIEAKYAVEAAINEPGPVYLRFGRYDVPVFNTNEDYSTYQNVIDSGKKGIAFGIVYGAFDIIKEKMGEEPMTIFTQALENLKPVLETKSRRVGGATYQVPMEIRPERRQTLAIRWLVTYARKRGGEKEMDKKLAAEILDAYNNAGGAIKKKDEMHRMAEANKAFAHFKW